MKRIAMLFLAVIAVAAVSTGCAHTFAGGLGPSERSYAGGFGAKSDVRLYGSSVELNINTNSNRRAERYAPLIHEFFQNGVISLGGELVKAGGKVKMSVTITDIESAILVTMKLEEEGHLPSSVTDGCGVPPRQYRARNISNDELFFNALKCAAIKGFRFLGD